MIKLTNNKHDLLKHLKNIRQEIPLSLFEQAHDIGISPHTLINWQEDIANTIPARPIVVRKIKEYIEDYYTKHPQGE